MKRLPTLLGIAVVVFWIGMNGFLVKRQIELRDLTRYQKGVAEYLGPDLKRERWMSIYRKENRVLKKKGYTGLILEKVYGEESIEYRASVETLYRGAFPFQGIFSRFAENSNSLKVQGSLVFDPEMKPSRLQVDITLTLLEGTPLSNSRTFTIEGQREEDQLRVVVLQGDEVLMHLPLPLDGFTLSNGLTPTLHLAGFEVGETFQLRVFDPLGLAGNVATVRVLDQKTEEVHGASIDVYELETEYHGNRTRSLVTVEGEVIRQELGPPLGLVLRHVKSSHEARLGFEQ